MPTLRKWGRTPAVVFDLGGGTLRAEGPLLCLGQEPLCHWHGRTISNATTPDRNQVYHSIPRSAPPPGPRAAVLPGHAREIPFLRMWRCFPAPRNSAVCTAARVSNRVPAQMPPLPKAMLARGAARDMHRPRVETRRDAPRSPRWSSRLIIGMKHRRREREGAKHRVALGTSG